jgi:hyperosmotically inducible periplasmic protein
MKKLTTFLLSGVLLIGVAACGNDTEKTSADAPSTTQASPEAPDADAAQQTQKDAQSEVRRKQLNSDIRAKEERNNALNQGAAQGRDEDTLASEVRSKLEANIPAGQLVIEGEDNGVITVSGTVPTQQQLAKIEPLAKQIKGVQTVNVKATVAPAKADDNQNTNNQKTQ